MHVLVTCKYIKDWIKKKKREKVETPFSPFNGGFLLPWTTEFGDPICLKHYAAFPHPSDATHKIWSGLANWHQRYSSSKVWNFCHSRESNSKTSGLIWPKFKCDRALMPVLVTSNFDDDSIKNDRASMETPFSHYKSMRDILHIKFDQDWPTGLRDIQVRKCKTFVMQGQVTPKWVVWSGPKSNSSKLLCLYWLSTLTMIRSTMNELAWRQHFPIISLWKFFKRSRAANSVVSGPIWPKFELVRDFMHVLVICKYKKDRMKNNWEKVETSFSPL